MQGSWNTLLSFALPYALAMLAAGALSGVIAGMLGVGGGIVLVPVLEWVLSLTGVSADLSIKVAVATSLVTIIPTAISSSRAHARRDAIDRQVVRAWALPIVVGALVAALLAARLNGAVLRLVFAGVAALVALKMLLPLDHVTLRRDLPLGWRASWLPFLIGSVSTLMGIGGGSLSVPVMTLCNQPMHRAVGTASLLGLWIAAPATLGFLLADVAHLPMPPFNVGYVNCLGFALIAPATWLAAPLGAQWAHRLTRRQLSLAFGLFLMLMAVRMVWRSL
ncbi:MAG: sulfite exporter TauE/SafE family protein [Steroidobacteraceae bacterium]